MCLIKVYNLENSHSNIFLITKLIVMLRKIIMIILPRERNFPDKKMVIFYKDN